MKVKVDKSLCIGCGSCVSVCPECFEITEDGKSEVKKDCDLEANLEKIKEAEDICPVKAIIIEEE